MNGDRFFRTAALVFIAIVLASVLVTVFMRGLKGRSAAPSLTGEWQKLELVLQQIEANYVDTVDARSISEALIKEALHELDPHSVYLPPQDLEAADEGLQGQFDGIGITFNVPSDTAIVINTIPGGPSEKAGLLSGDRIIRIDGDTVAGVRMPQDSMVARMKGPSGTKVLIEVKRSGVADLLPFTITRSKIPIKSIDCAFMVNDTTGYIKQTGFTDNVSDDIRAGYFKLKSQGMKRLVLDLRGNGGGLMNEAIDIVSLFLPKGSLVVTAKGNTPESVREYRTSSEPVDTLMPLIVLVDSGSASSSEIVSGAIQDHDRGTIMGERTFGKGLVQTVRPVVYNGQLKVTTAKYYTPSGRCVQAIDYSHRNEDGSVGHIPDSLTHEFRTAKGRIVRDGGGITPDVKLEVPSYSRLVYSLVLNGILDRYAIKYAREHDTIPALDDFRFTDEDFEDFVEFARTQDFDYRSSGETLFDQMKKALEEDGLAENMKPELEALEKAISLDKEEFIRLKKDEIIPFIEEEIAVRYYWQEAGIKVRLRYDDELREALESPMIM